MNKLKSITEDFLMSGLSILPVRKDKRPALTEWKQLQVTPYDYDGDLSMFDNCWGIGVICGKVSGNLECIDFDAHDKNIHEIFKKWGDEQGVNDIVIRNKLYVEKSPRGGYHVFYRYELDSDETPETSRKISNWENGESMIETKGEGGYVVIAPSPAYIALRNDLSEIATISKDERDYLLQVAEEFNEQKKSEQPAQAEVVGYSHTDPISWFNWNKAPYAKNLLKEKGWSFISRDEKQNIEYWRRPGKDNGTSATWGKNYNALYVFSSSASPFADKCYYTPFQILTILRFKGKYNSAIRWIEIKYFQREIPYIRVKDTYFKVIKKIDRYGFSRKEIVTFKKDEIKQDESAAYIDQIPKFDDFRIEPNNFKYEPVIDNCWNLYKEFSHKPAEGTFNWSHQLMGHIFGEQIELGYRYMQALYLHPKRMLPILVLISRKRQTGKSTFLNWLNIIFGDNVANISPEDLTGSFNHVYATSNIVAIEETLIEKSITVEKLKSLATGKQITVNQKFVSQYNIPFFGKIVLASNNEDKFARIDEEEIRFFVRKVPKPKTYNHYIEDELVKEVPAFLHHLTTLPAINWGVDRTGFTPEELTNDDLVRVKDESKSGLYKEMMLLFTDFFNNNNYAECYCSPIDIYQRWFERKHNMSGNYIATILRDDFRISPVSGVMRYSPFNEGLASKTGRPYLFLRKWFVTDEGYTTQGEIPWD